ncbi:hypothetical protein LTR91_009507 [Friedmanniomyces endolithicus]|uniref:DUF4048 domain-containing protein n=1 Tax=Friedmanniomyces endolithicus TaxID=329885 RepID=A0AAN6KL83_9PEZI|nr:hypothetical protein LTR94_013557 [Friedmanniomyces endolithicus]KAK0781418.1 hypothetical protein LTR59_012516 [Friedmanniomyces endolithicus]KAK0790448.1 hypothetical protein LTR38_010555 [Friedmanniomyces endolithicus]KAK0806436.1 hypothetical protein LTR75_006975 [Friedmanniomyces endolithicus]KAK0840702.1 hypothetical protein LTR03_010379 [Friedmanniomyces endolithicus]
MDDDMDEPTTTPPSVATKRQSTVQPIEVQAILNGSGVTPAKSSPVEHPTSPRCSDHSSPRSHGRASSIAESTSSSATVRTNRFSVSFPVQRTGTGASSPTRILAQSPTRDGPSVIPETLASPTGPTDTNFLTAIAASERKVLELREELQRAEADLNKLKKHWIQHEASKKRNDARRVTKLQSLQTSLPASAGHEEDAHASSARMQLDMERRKALFGAERSSTRTVFAGSRHTRTLSLLPPATEARPPAVKEAHPPPIRNDSIARASKRSTDSDRPANVRPALLARASTTPDLTTEIADSADPGLELSDNFDKAQLDPLIQQGRKIASDLGSGLWTFFEDLRQATVGDEATQAASTNRQPVLPAKKQGSGQARTGRSTLRPAPAVTADKTRSAAAKTPSPARRHVKSATQGALPDLADPSFFSEQAVGVITTPVKTMKKSPAVRGGHGHTRATPSKSLSTTSMDSPWDTWPDNDTTLTSSSPSKRRTSRSDSSSDASTATTTTTLPFTLPSAVSSPRPSFADSRSRPPGPPQGTEKEKKEPIPWPALSKFGPATLRRTASHLMSEWERSLTPSPGKELRGQEDYLGFGAGVGMSGMGAEAAAFGRVGGKGG